MTVPQTQWQKFLAGGHGYSVKPLRNTEIAEFYWLTDIKTHEICEAFPCAVNSSVQTISAEAGPAVFEGCKCQRCEGYIYVFSRQQTVDRFMDLKKYSEHERRAAWASPLICHECKRTVYDLRHEQYREEDRLRQRRINELKYMPYRDYLLTPEWKQTREAALRRAKYCCQTCSSKQGLQVHHRTYVRRGAEHSSDLITLCGRCHSVFHTNLELADGGRAA